jgi:hypothetical protein
VTLVPWARLAYSKARIGRIVLGTAAARDGHQRIDVAGRERRDPGAGVPSRDNGGQEGVDGPRVGRPARRAELRAHHVDDVRGVGQAGEVGVRGEVEGHCLDATVTEAVGDRAVGPAGDGHDSGVGASGGVEAESGEVAQAGSHLAAGAEHEEITLECGEIGHQGRRWLGQRTFQVVVGLEHSCLPLGLTRRFGHTHRLHD